MKYNSTDQASLLERMVRRAFAQIRENAVPFFSALVFGLLAHMYAFTNKLVNHDEVGSLLNKGTTVTSGRWGLDLMSAIFPDYSMPWIYGILSVLLLAAAVCIMVRLFRIENKLLQGLLAGTVLVFPSLTSTVCFMYTLSSYAVSFLLAVGAVRILTLERKWSFPAALACMVFSLGIYQSYISIAATLLVLLLVQALLRGEDVSRSIRRGFLYLGFLAASLGVYYLITLLFNKISGTVFNDYANARIRFSLSYLPAGAAAAYKAFLRFFVKGSMGLMPTRLSRLIHLLCLAAVGVLLLLWFLGQKKKEWGRLALLAAMIVLLPLAMNCIYLFVADDASLATIHTLVLYSFSLIYLFMVIVLEACTPYIRPSARLVRQICLDVITLGLAAVILLNVYVSNAAYLSMHLRYENAYAFYTTLAADLKMQPEFNESTKLALIGEYQEPGFYWNEFEFTYQVVGTTGFLPDADSRYYFLEYYLGFHMPMATREEAEAIAAMPEFAEMAVYPFYGSMRMIGDCCVVKLSG